PQPASSRCIERSPLPSVAMLKASGEVVDDEIVGRVHGDRRWTDSDSWLAAVAGVLWSGGCSRDSPQRGGRAGGSARNVRGRQAGPSAASDRGLGGGSAASLPY